MTRTFSKIHGLGGLRVGWGYGPAHVIEVLNRVRGPFNLSTPALAAAEAAVRDTGWTARCFEENRRNRGRLAAELAAAGVPSRRVAGQLRAGAVPRPRDGGGLRPGAARRRDHRAPGGGLQAARGLRITVGDAEACARVAAAVGQFMKVRA